MDETEFYSDSCGYFEGLISEEIIFKLPEEDECSGIVSDCFPEKKLLYPKADPQEIIYASLLEMGYRRSGNIVYQAVCPGCRKCKGIRVPADRFIPSKSQRRVLRKNSDIEITLCQSPEDFVTDEKIALFQKYDGRHNPGKTADAESAEQVLVNINGLDAEGKKSYHGSFNMDFRINGRLIGVSVLDRALDSLSSVYFYFDTAEDILPRSVGVFSVLKEIEACRGEIFGGTLKAGWYYLGYYIEDCRKMNYKAQYNPHQLLDIGGKWKYDGGKNEASRKDG